MNNEKIVKDMIIFIRETEKDIQTARMSGENRNNKTDVVNAILVKLEGEVANEN